MKNVKKHALKENDFFQVSFSFSSSKQYDEALIYCYQPLLGRSALSLYNVLKKEAIQSHETVESLTFDFLIKILGTSLIDCFNGIKILEKQGLLKTYLKNQNSRNLLPNIYIFELLEPLDVSCFLTNEPLKTMLISNIGQTNFNILVHKFLNANTYENASDISVPVHKAFVTSNNPSNRSVKNLTNVVLNFIKQENIVLEKGMQNDISVAINYFKLSENVVMLLLKKLIKTGKYVERSSFQKLIKEYMLPSKVKNGNEKQTTTTEKIVENWKDAKIKEMEFNDCISYFEGLHERKITKQQTEFLVSVIKKHNLSKPILNCIMDFSYFKNNYEWRGNYIKKIASTVAEKGISSATGTMNFLMNLKKPTPPSPDFTKRDGSVSKGIIYSDFKWE